MPLHPYSGLELLDTPVMIVERSGQLHYANPASENLLGISHKGLRKLSLYEHFHDAKALRNAVQMALDHAGSFIEHDLELTPEGDQALHIGLTVTPIDGPVRLALVEMRPIEQQLRIVNEGTAIAAAASQSRADPQPGA